MVAPCFLFPGQGSQVLGMGRAFFDEYNEVKSLFDEASETTGIDIAKLCFSGPFDELTRTKNLQPAMTAVTLSCLFAIEDYDIIPSYVAGHSLGEYAALCSARVISISDCLRLVTERGRLMDEQAEKHPGAMSAIVKFDSEKLETIVAEVAKSEPVLIANYNSPSQLVISGSTAGVEQTELMVREQGGRPIRLKVSGAWHSEMMRAAEEPLNALIDEIEFNEAKLPVIMNVTGLPETDAATIKENLKRQMCSGVKWYQGIQQSWLGGVRTYIEVGPKGVLAKMLRSIVPDPPAMDAFVIDSPIALRSYFDEDDF